jgi:hypothetical protein
MSEEDWTPELEEALFSAACYYRPIGVHRHFRILNVQKYLMHHQGKQVSIPTLWARLSLYYDLPSLNAMVWLDFTVDVSYCNKYACLQPRPTDWHRLERETLH